MAVARRMFPPAGAKTPLRIPTLGTYTFGAEAKAPSAQLALSDYQNAVLLAHYTYRLSEEVERATTAGCPTGSLHGSINTFWSINLYKIGSTATATQCLVLLARAGVIWGRERGRIPWCRWSDTALASVWSLIFHTFKRNNVNVYFYFIHCSTA